MLFDRDYEDDIVEATLQDFVGNQDIGAHQAYRKGDQLLVII